MLEPNRRHEFLNSEELALFEELKLVQKIMFDYEDAYSKWEAWFFVGESILVSAIIQLLLNSDLPLFSLFVALLGMILSFMFLIIQNGNHIYATARLKRWRDLENLLSKNLTNGHGVFMGILAAQEEEIRRHLWYRKPFTTWSMRKAVPLVFIIFWGMAVIIAGIPSILVIWRILNLAG